MRNRHLILAAFLLFGFGAIASAQHLFMTADTNGFGSPALTFGVSSTHIDPQIGQDYTLLTARLSVGIGRKTDIFGSFDAVFGGDIFNTDFGAFSLGLEHTFIRAHLVNIAGVFRFRGNRTDFPQYESTTLDFAGMVSINAGRVHPYYAWEFTRPFGLSFTDNFQRTHIFGAEVPIGDIPRILGEFSVGDRRSIGVAFKLAF